MYGHVLNAPGGPVTDCSRLRCAARLNPDKTSTNKAMCMGIGEDFASFCSALTVSRQRVIADRYAQITRRLNLDCWNSDSGTYHSFYTGSYGRGTAIDSTSDVGMVFRLLASAYERFDAYSTNGQAALLQEVRASIKKTYVCHKVVWTLPAPN